ncbi:MAG: toxic anion resistance protein [Desulfovibrio sp.]|jgi:uncharacterized protein YaaN involved in tellurite resistance|nr:toxic anion resistance protein [Desulfovibrio sp.]
MSDNTAAPLVPSFPSAFTDNASSSSPASEDRVRELAESIDLRDPGLSVSYGAKTMVDISRFADDLLSRVRVNDSGPVGDILTELLLRVKDVDFTQLHRSGPGLLERLPFIGSLFNAVNRSIARFDSLAGQVESIVGKLDMAMIDLLRDVEMLEQLYEHNKNFHNELNLFIAAGKQRLERARACELPQLKEKTDNSDDAMLAQNVRDFVDALNRFEHRLHDLQLSRAITLQSAPQIRLIQNNNQTLAEKIQASILTTLPIWKSQMVLALSLYRQQNTAKLHKEVADTTNGLLRRNAEALQSATTATAREVERSIVDITTLRDIHGKLLATIEETLRISLEAQEKRREVEKELTGMEHELRNSLASFSQDKANM